MNVAFDAGDRDPFDDWRFAVGPWRPRPLTRPEPKLPIRLRVALALAIALAHVALLYFAAREDGRLPASDAGLRTTLVFLSPPAARPRPATATPAPTSPRVRSPAAPDIPAPVEATRPPSPREGTPAAGTASRDAPVSVDPPTPAASPGAPLRLYESDGSLALPDDLVARMREVDAGTRTFDFQLPGLEESGRFMKRQPVLVHETTRFDEYWIPDRGALTRILEQAVKATTKSVEIPIPGVRGGKLVCSVSILALGGGCGVTNNADGYVVGRDDPDTLSPEEDAQCRAWWEQIVAAGDQDTWRHTRALYEAHCRKPLADVPPEPP